MNLVILRYLFMHSPSPSKRIFMIMHSVALKPFILSTTTSTFGRSSDYSYGNVFYATILCPPTRGRILRDGIQCGDDYDAERGENERRGRRCLELREKQPLWPAVVSKPTGKKDHKEATSDSHVISSAMFRMKIRSGDYGVYRLKLEK